MKTVNCYYSDSFAFLKAIVGLLKAPRCIVRHALDMVLEERNRGLSFAPMEVCNSPGRLCDARLMPEYPPRAASPRQPEQMNRYDDHFRVGGLIVVFVVEVERRSCGRGHTSTARSRISALVSQKLIKLLMIFCVEPR